MHISDAHLHYAGMEACVGFAQTGCHAGGGNIVQAGASLQTGDLQKNGAASTDAIYKLIYSGKGKMPGYGKECTPRVEIQTLPSLHVLSKHS